jgi:hypothetical protein
MSSDHDRGPAGPFARSVTVPAASSSIQGLTTLFDEWAGATGTIVVLNGRTRDVTAVIDGSRDFADYPDAIDSALNRVRVQ